MGELAPLYALADVVFVGGSLVPVGGAGGLHGGRHPATLTPGSDSSGEDEGRGSRGADQPAPVAFRSLLKS